MLALIFISILAKIGSFLIDKTNPGALNFTVSNNFCNEYKGSSCLSYNEEINKTISDRNEKKRLYITKELTKNYVKKGFILNKTCDSISKKQKEKFKEFIKPIIKKKVGGELNSVEFGIYRKFDNLCFVSFDVTGENIFLINKKLNNFLPKIRTQNNRASKFMQKNNAIFQDFAKNKMNYFYKQCLIAFQNKTQMTEKWKNYVNKTKKRLTKATKGSTLCSKNNKNCIKFTEYLAKAATTSATPLFAPRVIMTKRGYQIALFQPRFIGTYENTSLPDCNAKSVNIESILLTKADEENVKLFQNELQNANLNRTEDHARRLVKFEKTLSNYGLHENVIDIETAQKYAFNYKSTDKLEKILRKTMEPKIYFDTLLRSNRYSHVPDKFKKIKVSLICRSYFKALNALISSSHSEIVTDYVLLSQLISQRRKIKYFLNNKSESGNDICREITEKEFPYVVSDIFIENFSKEKNLYNYTTENIYKKIEKTFDKLINRTTLSDKKIKKIIFFQDSLYVLRLKHAYPSTEETSNISDNFYSEFEGKNNFFDSYFRLDEYIMSKLLNQLIDPYLQMSGYPFKNTEVKIDYRDRGPIVNYDILVAIGEYPANSEDESRFASLALFFAKELVQSVETDDYTNLYPDKNFNSLEEFQIYAAIDIVYQTLLENFGEKRIDLTNFFSKIPLMFCSDPRLKYYGPLYLNQLATFSGFQSVYNCT